MSGMVIMPKADWQAALDATRAKTGKGELIKSGELAAEIEGITGGGGKPFDCRSVTFMHAGEVHYVRSVGDGDTCADPVVRGLVAAPTKESTAQYDYPHAGWSLTDGGSASSSALANVTEDRTVYAAFSQATRYYTVNYYDGDTLLHSVQVAYGDTPPAYTPSKEGYDLSGWDPALSTVYGDTNYYAVWSEKITFLGGTWEEIAAISEAGKASEYFSIGDSRTETVNGVTIEYVIADFNYDILTNGKTAGMTILTKSIKDASGDKKTTYGSGNTYVGSTLDTEIQNIRNNYVSSDLKNVVKQTAKKCYGASAVLNTANMSFWAPSLGEIRNTAYKVNNDYTFDIGERQQSRPYALFTQSDLSKAGLTSSGSRFWVRTIDTFRSTSNKKCVISVSNSSTSATQTVGSNSNAVRFGFCI